MKNLGGNLNSFTRDVLKGYEELTEFHKFMFRIKHMKNVKLSIYVGCKLGTCYEHANDVK